MKRILFLLLLILPLASALKAQNNVIVKATINPPMAGQYVFYQFVSGPGAVMTVSTVQTTDTLGNAVVTHSYGGAPTGIISCTILNCKGDSVKLYNTYDTSKNNDTIYYNFDYCDTICGTLNGTVGHTDTGSTFYFSQSVPSSVNKYTWDFGDGTTATGPSPVKTYTAFGTYTVKLTIEDTVNHCSKDLYDFAYYGPLYYDTLIIHAKLKDTMLAGKQMVLNYTDYFRFKVKNDTVTTNSSGEYTGPFVVNTLTGQITLIITDCQGNPSYAYGYYDTLTDTVNIEIMNCFPCYTLSANLSVTASGGVTTVYNYSAGNKYHWDFGDGTTSNATNPVTHAYSADGTYDICLTVEDTVYGCSKTTCKSVSITVPRIEISGRVSMDSSSNAVDSLTCRVYLIKRDSVGSDILLTAVDSVLTYSLGYYRFTNVPSGYYQVKAALLSASPYFADYIPSYYQKSVLWSGGTMISVLNSLDISGADITLVKGTNPGGSGFIGGFVSMGANKTGDPMEQVEVLLLNNSGRAVAYAYTDGSGEYRFDNLAWGTYRLLVEIPGKPSEEYTITLDANHTEARNRNFDVNSRNVKKSVTTGINEPGSNGIIIYPNPATTEINISLDAAADDKAEISISDMTGRILIQTTQELQAGKNTLNLDTGLLNGGIYIINIRSGAGNHTQKICVNK